MSKAKEMAEGAKANEYYFNSESGGAEWRLIYQFTPEQLKQFAHALCEEQIEAVVENGDKLLSDFGGFDQNLKEALLSTPNVAEGLE